MDSINTITEWISAVTKALRSYNVERLEELQRINDNWLQSEEERNVGNELIDTVIEIIEEADLI